MASREKILFAASRPDLVFRKIRGLSVIEITPNEARRYLPNNPVILEAGALNGLDTVRLASEWPQGVVHAFEPVPSAYEDVVRRTCHLDRVRRYNVALSHSSGKSPMHVSSDVMGGPRTDSSSLLRPADHLRLIPDVVFGDTIDVDTLTIDDWASQNGIGKVDFMWLDMQGSELGALKASPRIMATVSVVCMEVSRSEMYAGSGVYGDVCSWMKDLGFRIAINRVSLHFGNMMFVRGVREISRSD